MFKIEGGHPESFYEVEAQGADVNIPRDGTTFIDIDRITRQLHLVPFYQNLPKGSKEDDESESQDNDENMQEDEDGEPGSRLLAIPIWDVR